MIYNANKAHIVIKEAYFSLRKMTLEYFTYFPYCTWSYIGMGTMYILEAWNMRISKVDSYKKRPILFTKKT